MFPHASNTTSPTGAVVPLHAVNSLSAKRSPTAGGFSSSSHVDSSTEIPGSAPIVDKSKKDSIVHVIPDSFPLPPAQIHAIGKTNSAVNTGFGDAKTRSDGASTMQAADGIATSKPVVEKIPSRSTVSKREGAFALPVLPPTLTTASTRPVTISRSRLPTHRKID